MLDQAADKIREQRLAHISLRQMDALNLSFPDDSFDYVMAFHVVSVVPDATRLLDEARRVLRPNGTLVVINHFRSERPLIGSLVEMADPVTRRLGWRTTLRLVDMFNGRPSPSSSNSRLLRARSSPSSSRATRRKCVPPLDRAPGDLLITC